MVQRPGVELRMTLEVIDKKQLEMSPKIAERRTSKIHISTKATKKLAKTVRINFSGISESNIKFIINRKMLNEERKC